jgi:hypothetical protein
MNSNTMKKLILSLVFVALIVGGIRGFVYLKNSAIWARFFHPTSTPVESPISGTGELTPSPRETLPTPSDITPLVPRCELKGEIIFYRGDNVYSQASGGFLYRDVGDPHSLVRWTITPKEDVAIGPNMFSSLPLPDGEDTTTLLFANGLPEYDTYTIHASIDYPAWDGEKTIIRNVVCGGEIHLNVVP